MEKKWLTVKEAAEYIGVAVNTIYVWLREGKLVRYKVGGITRIKVDELDQIMEEGRENGGNKL